MCGIAGFSGAFEGALLGDMSQVMAHRGPDSDGACHIAAEGIGLAHRRLAILDVSSAGAQPMWDAAETVCITYNGEIYNFRELRQALAANGCQFRGHSDTEVLVNLYLRYGREMLRQLNGIYAFAIWDKRSRELFVARDGLGVKPLYFAETADGFLFASEIKSLLRHPGVERSIDVGTLANYLSNLLAPAPDTVLSSVKKLEPGCALRIANGKVVEHWRHYDLAERQQPIEEMSEAEGVAQVRDAVRTAVHRQMVADVPVGAFLSGGLDSSAVVAFAREYTDAERLQCFTIGMDDEASKREGLIDDLPYAKRVADHLGVDLRVVPALPEMADDLPKMIYHSDEPLADPAALNVMAISGLARAQDIKVLLSGTGGDDIFTGYRRHRALTLERYWSWLPTSARRGLSGLAQVLPSHPAQMRKVRKAFRYAGLDGDARLASYFYWLDPGIVADLLAPDKRAAWVERAPLQSNLAALPASVPALNRMLYLECRHFLTDHNLNYTDKMSMAAGVEVRVPLIDPDLVDLAFRLPLRFKQHGAIGKWVFKRAMEGILPNDVIYRPKTGFGAPLRSWLHGPLRELLRDTLSAETLLRRGLFDGAAVERLIALDKANRIDASYPLFALLCFELWCRIFLDGVTPSATVH